MNIRLARVCCIPLLLAFSPVAGRLFSAETKPADLVCEGVLGNSGAQGDTLVRFGEKPARGMGVVCDRFGSLWDRGGEATLNRYAPDGRLLAQYPLARAAGGNDKLTAVGDLLVLLVGDQLYTLPVAAKTGTAPQPLGVRCEGISFGSAGGRIACHTKGDVSLVDPADGRLSAAAKLDDVQQIELAPDGALYVQSRAKVYKLVNGQPVDDSWPKGSPGERMQLLAGQWFGHAWHGTIRRFNAELEPEPGVVLGGASGSFIGHLDQNAELSNGRGMARLHGDLYAVSGIEGTLHLLRWDGQKRQMEIVRRIGAVPDCRGLGLDRDGNVWCYAGSWQWTDGPDAPLRFGVNAPEWPGVGQAVMLPGDRMLAPGHLWGKPSFYRGPLTGEVRADRIEQPCGLQKDCIGSAVYRRDKRLVLLTIDKSGAGVASAIGDDGTFQADEGTVALHTATPVKEWTTLAMKTPDVLLGAADGQVIELARDGSDWKETRRWNSWGAGALDKFGEKVYIAADAGRLWVSDRQQNRVVVLDLSSGKLLAGGLSQSSSRENGTVPFAPLSAPEVIAARGDRAVVFDGGNQRLVKLRLK